LFEEQKWFFFLFLCYKLPLISIIGKTNVSIKLLSWKKIKIVFFPFKNLLSPWSWKINNSAGFFLFPFIFWKKMGGKLIKIWKMSKILTFAQKMTKLWACQISTYKKNTLYVLYLRKIRMKSYNQIIRIVHKWGHNLRTVGRGICDESAITENYNNGAWVVKNIKIYLTSFMEDPRGKKYYKL
jgi:hypothetical protein